MKKVLILLIFCFSSLLLSAQTGSKQTAGELLVDGVAAYNAGEYDKALDLLSKLSEKDPRNDAALYYMGLCMLQQNNIQRAQSLLQEAVAIDSTNFWYYEKLAAVYAYQGKQSEAITAYERMQAIQPRNVEPAYQLVNLYAMQNRMDKVLEALDDIESLQGKSEPVTNTRYEVYMRQNKPKEAWAALESFNEEISSPDILVRMGDFKAMEGEDSLAIVYFDQALDVMAGYPEALLGKADIYRGQRRYDDFFACMGEFATNPDLLPAAKAAYLENTIRGFDPNFLRNHAESIDKLVDDATATHPADTSLLMMAGSYYYSTARYPQATDRFRECVIRYPDDFGTRVFFLQALDAMKNYSELSIAADGAFEHFPEVPEILEFKASALYTMGQYEEVIKTLERMVAAAPLNNELALYAYSLMGDCYHLLDNSKKAYKCYDKALKIDPRSLPVLNNYAYYLSLEGKNLKKAYKMSVITMEDEPDNATYMDTFGWIQHLMGKDVEARQTFKRAMLYGGKESATILEHYATVLEALGDDATAKVYRDMAAKATTD